MSAGVVDELNRHAADIGADVRLVQGAGGNLSGKDGGTVWIKASGTRFVEALQRPIFVGVDGERAREEVLRTEDLQHLVVDLPEGAPPRPSIETALHVLLPHRYVFHVHAVGAIAAAVSSSPAPALARLQQVTPVVGHVPYAKPGMALARAVLAALADLGAGSQDAVLLLGNHGLLTASDSADRAHELVDAVEAALRTDVDLPLAVRTDSTALAPAGSVSPAGARLLAGGVLTPDAAVFLGSRPFAADLGGGASAAVAEDGSVSVREDLSRDAREVALSFVHVAAHAVAGAAEGAAVDYLDDEQVGELVDWEAEKWRRGMQR